MNIVIAAGCPHSGWEMVIPVLQQAGLAASDDGFVQWHDRLFAAAGIIDPLSLRQALQPDAGMTEEVANLVKADVGTTELLADSRAPWLLDFWAATLPEARFLLFYTRAETAVAHALLQGLEPLSYLEAWQAANRQLLTFQRRHRRRALLLDAEAGSQQPQSLIELCREQDLPLKNRDDWSVPAPTAVLERWLGGYLVTAHSDIQTLQMELEASAQPFGDTILSTSPQTLELLNEYRQRQSAVRQQQAEQDKDLADLQARLEQEQQMRQTLEASYKEATQENELLLLQLHQVQEELEALFLQKQQFEQEKETLIRDRQKLTAEADAQKKLVAELRAQLEQTQQGRQELESSHKETAQENELLLLQLHQVQEELETIFLQKQALEQAGRVAGTLIPATDDLRPVLSAEGPARPTSSVQQENSWALPAPVRELLEPLTSKRKEKARLRKQVQLLKDSGLFDEKWYLAQYPDVAQQGHDPVQHYLRFGAKEGRNPSPQFNTQFYMSYYPDVIEAGMNPLVHYIKFGQAEHRHAC